MQAGQELLLELLGGQNQQFEIPLYQRRYSWTDAQRRQLWEDILRVAEAPRARRHFTGSVVYTEPKGGMGGRTLHRSRLIDGQQRVTTTTLLLQALAEHLEAHPEAAQVTGTTADAIRRTYLLNEKLGGDQHFKLSLSAADHPTLRAILRGEALPKQPAQEVRDGLQFFRDRLAEPGLDISRVWRGLQKLEVVQITLNEGVDDLGLIFESLNSTGKALAQADLIRNNVLMGLDDDEQADLSDTLWQPMERMFAGTEDGAFDRFIRDWLTLRTRNLPNEDEVYAAFKDHRQGRPAGEKVTGLVEDISTMAGHYLKIIRPEREENPAVRQALEDLLALRVKVIQPFVLELLQDREQGLLDHASLERALRAIESFLMRRAVLGERTSPLNRFFATLGRDLPRQGDYVRELERALVRFQDREQDGFPGDDAFLRALQEVPLYSRPVCKPLLIRLERQQNTKESFGGLLTIEHVMPQNTKLSEAWQQMLGSDWPQVQRDLVHTLGNLTLTGYNSELGDRPFQDKKTLPPRQGDTAESAQPKGYKYSRLLLTQEIAKYPEWNADMIRQRARTLAEQAVKLFPYPPLPEAEIEQLRQEGRQRSRTPTVEAHLDTSSQALRALFMQMRSRLLGFGDQVVEEPKKHYVAYKAGSNFCDMVPQPALNTVKCWLNIPPEELGDPDGLVQDIGGKGKAGNGNAELVVSLHSDLRGFEALAKQAMEYQLARKGKSATSSAASEEADGSTVDFSQLPQGGQELLRDLETRCQNLGVQARDRQNYRAFSGRRVFMEVYPRSSGIRLAVKVDHDQVSAEESAGWNTQGSKTAWLYRTVETPEELDDAWAVIQRGCEQQAGTGSEPLPSVPEFIERQDPEVHSIIRAVLTACEDFPLQQMRVNPAQKSFSLDTQVGTAWKPFMEVNPVPDGRVRLYLYTTPAQAGRFGLQDEIKASDGFLSLFLKGPEDVERFEPLIDAAYAEKEALGQARANPGEIKQVLDLMIAEAQVLDKEVEVVRRGRSTYFHLNGQELARLRKNETDGFVCIASAGGMDVYLRGMADVQAGRERLRLAFQAKTIR